MSLYGVDKSKEAMNKGAFCFWAYHHVKFTEYA